MIFTVYLTVSDSVRRDVYILNLKSSKIFYVKNTCSLKQDMMQPTDVYFSLEISICF